MRTTITVKAEQVKHFEAAENELLSVSVSDVRENGPYVNIDINYESAGDLIHYGRMVELKSMAEVLAS